MEKTGNTTGDTKETIMRKKEVMKAADTTEGIVGRNKGGRPLTSLTLKQIEEVEKLAQGLTIEQIADYLGIGQTTFYRIQNRQSEVSVAYKKGKQRAVERVISKLLEKIEEGDTACMIFYLKTQAGWRERRQVDISTDGTAYVPSIIISTRIKNEDEYTN